MEELKRKAAQNSGDAEYIEKVVYTVKQSAEDVKKLPIIISKNDLGSRIVIKKRK